MGRVLNRCEGYLAHVLKGEDCSSRRGRWATASKKTIPVAVVAIMLMSTVISVAVNSGSHLGAERTASASALFDTLWTAEGGQAGAALGYSVASAGDVNNDGFDDVIAGAYNYDNGQTDEGRALVYYGSSTGLASTPAWMAESDQNYSRFGYSVSSAGDVNNDGYADVLVGAYVYDNGETDEGRAYLFLGSASGPSLTPSWTAEGNQASAYFGSSVAAAGDVNNDGYGDVLVASLFYTNGESSEGRVFMYLGSAAGLPTTASWTAEGNQNYSWFGRSVASAGDVNNDGYDDVIIGAYYYDNGESNEGRAYLYLGSASGLSDSPAWTGEINQANAWFGYSVSSAGDVNNDGFDDVIVGATGYDNPELYEGSAYLYLGSASGLSATPAWTGESNQANAYYGVVSSAGDVNNDGFDDVIVGAYFYDNDTADEGRVYLYLGSSTGLPSTPSWTAESDQYNAMFGSSLASAGDVNNDGSAEIIIGAYSYDLAKTDEGRVYVFYGLAAAPQVTQIALTAGWNMISLPRTGVVYRASTLGLLTGDVVAGWNPATRTYDKNYIVGGSPPPLDFAIEDSTGYWVYAHANEILNISGSIPTTSQTKTVTVPSGGGWAILGLLGLNQTRKASDIPKMYTDQNITSVAMFDSVAGKYVTYIKGAPFSDFTLIPGRAYMCYCTTNGTLTYTP